MTGLSPDDIFNHTDQYEPEGDHVYANGAGATGPARLIVQTAAQFVRGFTPPEYILDGIAQAGYLYSFTGKTGSGKTAVALMIACCIALGRPIGGREVAQGDVLYLAGENPDDVRARFILQCEALNIQPSEIPIHFVTERFSIEDGIQTLQRAIEKIGRPLRAIFVDTSAAFFPGDDENNNTQMGAFARSLRELTTIGEGKPTTFVLCHPTKAADRERLLPRGGGAFLAEVDGNLTLWALTPETSEMHWQGKFRGPSFEPFNWKLDRRSSPALVDKKGRKIPSVIASPISEEAQQRMIAAERSDEDAVLENLLNFSTASIAERCRQVGWMQSNGEPAKSKFARMIQKLEDDKLVKRHRGEPRLTETGRKEAERSLVRGAK